MVAIYRVYGGKKFVGIANSWEDFVTAERNKKMAEEAIKFADPNDRWVSWHDWEYYSNFLRERHFWAEPVENFSDCLEG